MNILSKLMIAASITLVTATAASAACNVNYRQFNQDHRIFKGVITGEVKYREYRRLERGQAKVQLMERVARADGHISPAECVLLNQALNNQSSRIWFKKHN
jgi:hypothetical protein